MPARPARDDPAFDSSLLKEARVIGAYLLGTPPDEGCCGRYAAGCRSLFPDGSGADDPLVGLAIRRPAALPLLDAACGLRRPGALLRRKVFLMLAVLEACPLHADRFLPRPAGRARLAAGLAWWGLCSALKGIAGLPLLAVTGRDR